MPVYPGALRVADHPEVIAFKSRTRLGMVGCYPFHSRTRPWTRGQSSRGGRLARPAQQSHTNQINRPAATIPIHNRIETKPATFAPAGKTPLSSQVATSR